MQEINMDKELKLIELLGYSVSDMDNSKRFKVYDDKNIEVGFIQYKKLKNANKKKNLPAKFGCVTKIDSSKIYYDSKEQLLGGDSNFQIDIKRENGNVDHLEIGFGDYPTLNLWSKNYGYMHFKVDYNGLFLNYKSKTSRYNLEKSLEIKIPEYRGKKFGYTFSFCEKDKDIDGSDVTVLTADYEEVPSYISKMDVKRIRFRGGKFIDENNIVENGTILDAIRNSEAIEDFKQFRILINQILPFKKEVISALLEDRKITEEEFAIFMPDIVQEQAVRNLRR